MRRLAVLLYLSPLLAGCVSAPRSFTSADHVTVPADELPGASGMQGWSPTKQEIAACERALAYRLAKSGYDLGSYYLRLAGVVREGSRRIVGMAADKQSAYSKVYLLPPSESTLVLIPFGGGDAYFRFEYNADLRRLVKLEFNAAL